MPRREHDAYYTPGWMTRALLRYGPSELVHNKKLRIFEPCVGDGAIVREFVAAGFENGNTNDIDPKITADFHFDAAQPWPAEHRGRYDWIPSNPPWAMPKNKPPLPVNILKHALENAEYAVSLLLRITFLEPCENRGEWLQANPPDQIIVLPRYSWTQNGKSDSATGAWMTWLKNRSLDSLDLPIVIANDAESL